MNFKLTASILIVMLGLLAVVIFLRHQSSSRIHQSHGQLFTTAKSPVVDLSFSAHQKPTLQMAKRGAHWYILSPRKAWGRDFAIGELCNQIVALKEHFRVHLASSGQYSAAKLGLKPARASLVMTRADGKKLELQIGRSTLGGRLYVATNPRYASVVSRRWLHNLLKGESHFATKSLTRFHAAAVEAISIIRGAKRLQITRHGKGWVINSPVLVRANPTKVTNWISNLQLLAAHRFTTSSDQKLKHVACQVIVTFRKTPPINGLPRKTKTKIPPPLLVSFGSYTDLTHHYVRALSNANPVMAIVRSTSVAQLDRSVRHFQDRALTRANLTSATAIAITRTRTSLPFAPAVLHLIRTGSIWKMGTSDTTFAGGPLLSARKAAVAKLLQSLAAVRAKSCNNTPSPKLLHMQPIGSLSIRLPHRLHPLVVTFGSGNKRGLSPVKVSGWRTIYMISTTRIAPLLPDAAVLRSHTVADVPASRVRRIVVQQGKNATQFVRTKGGWVIEPGTRKISQVDVASFTAELSPIQCHRWLTASPPHANAIKVKISYRAQSSPTSKQKPESAASSSLRNGTLRLWSKRSIKSAKGKNRGKVETLYYAQWFMGNASGAPWVFSPRQSLVSGVEQLVVDSKGRVVAAKK